MEGALLFQALVLVAAYSPPATVLSDVERFPPADISKQALAFNRAYVANLAEQSRFRPHFAHEFGELICEAHSLYYVWDCLNAANVGEGRADREYRMRWLECLRSCIGEEDYAAGRMPPTVPHRGFHCNYSVP